MSSYAKIYLSAQEQQLLYNAEWILTKRKIIESIVKFFDGLSPALEAVIEQKAALLPRGVMESRVKISKGENYLGLPYVMMDYPAMFKNENIFALRTMLWWGNFFSVTLQLSGIYKTEFEKNIFKNLPAVQDKFYACINEEQWQHHFEEANYIPAGSVNNENLHEMNKRDFLKIAVKIPVQEWENAGEKIIEAAADLLELLKP